MSNLDRLKSAYAAWNDTMGGSRDVWAALLADRFQLKHVDENSPGLGFAREVADRVVFMADGQIVEVGTPEHFFTDPQEERTQLFLSQIL